MRIDFRVLNFPGFILKSLSVCHASDPIREGQHPGPCRQLDLRLSTAHDPLYFRTNSFFREEFCGLYKKGARDAHFRVRRFTRAFCKNTLHLAPLPFLVRTGIATFAAGIGFSESRQCEQDGRGSRWVPFPQTKTASLW